MRTMYDSTAAGDIPTSAAMVAGYLAPSPWAWTSADWARFPNAVKVRIAVRAATNDGHVLDVEAGDATPAQAPGWVQMRRAAGADPTVYCSASAWPTVKAAFAAAGVTEPHYWVAAYPGGGRTIPAGAVAHQYADSTTSGGHFDLSVVADYWPGVDQGGDVTQPADFVNYVYTTDSTPQESIGHRIQNIEENTKNVVGAVASLATNTQKALTAQAAQITALQQAVAALQAGQTPAGTYPVTGTVTIGQPATD